MRLKRKKIVSLILSMLFPGTGHLYIERYFMGTAGVVLTTWSLLVLLISASVFSRTEGMGMLLFEISLYSVIGLWCMMLLSLILGDFRLVRKKVDRKELYNEGYTLFLAKKYSESLGIFSTLTRYFPEDVSAAVMAAKNYQRLSMNGKAASVLKKCIKRTSDPQWLWELNYSLDALTVPVKPE